MRKLAAISLVLLASSSALAQTRTTGSTGSGFTSGSIFSSTGPSTGTLNSSTSGTSGTSSSTSSLLSSNFSQGFAATGMTNPFGTATTGRAGMGMTGMGGMGMMGMGGMGMMGMGGMGMGMGGMGMGRGQQNMRGGMGGTGQQQYSLRPTVKLGFEPNLPATQIRSQAVRTTMTRIPGAERFAGVNVAVEGRKAIVTGTIDKGQADLLTRLLQLEPGIYEVDMSQVTFQSNANPS